MKATAKKPQDALRTRALKRTLDDLVAAVDGMLALPDEALTELFEGVGTKAPDKDDPTGCPTLTRSAYFTGRNGPEQAWLDQALLRLAPRVSDRVANAKSLTELSALHVVGGVSRPGLDLSLDWLASYEKLEHLGLSVMTPRGLDATAKLTKLREVTLHQCTLDDVGLLRACPAIETLRVLHGQGTLPSLGAWPTLRKLFVHEGATQFADHALAELRGLDELHLTRLLNLSSTALAKLGVPPSVTALDLSRSTFMRGIEGVERLTALRTLDISHAPIQSLDPLRDHPALVTLRGESTYGLTDLTPLATIATLRALHLAGATVSDIEALKGRPIEVLDLSNTQVRDLRALEGNTALRELSVSVDSGLLSLAPLADCTSLEALAVGHNDNPFLRSTIHGLAHMVDLKWMSRLTRLRSVRLVGPKLAKLDGIEGCTALTRFELIRAAELTDLTPLASLTALEGLAIRDSGVTDLTPLTSLTKLVALDLRDNKNLKDASPLWAMTSLKRVALAGSAVDRASTPKEWNRRITWAREADMDRAFEPEAEAKPRMVLGPKGQGATVRKQFSVIRAQLNSKDLEQIEQGAELLVALDDPSLFDEMIDGANYFDNVPANRKAIVHGGFTPPPTLGTTKTANAFQTAAILAVISRAPEGATKAIALRDAVRSFTFGNGSTWGNAGPFDLGPMARLPNLTKLQLLRPGELRNPDALRGHTQLTELHFSPGFMNSSLDLTGCASLRTLTIENISRFTRLDLTGCVALRSLDISNTELATAFVGANDLSALRSVSLAGSTTARWLSALPMRAQIETLSLEYATLPGLEDALAKCTGLRALTLIACRGELDFGCLTSAKKLTKLTLRQMYEQKQLGGLTKLTSLQEIRLTYSRLELPEAVMPLWKK